MVVWSKDPNGWVPLPSISILTHTQNNNIIIKLLQHPLPLLPSFLSTPRTTITVHSKCHNVWPATQLGMKIQFHSHTRTPSHTLSLTHTHLLPPTHLDNPVSCQDPSSVGRASWSDIVHKDRPLLRESEPKPFLVPLHHNSALQPQAALGRGRREEERRGKGRGQRGEGREEGEGGAASRSETKTVCMYVPLKCVLKFSISLLPSLPSQVPS